MDELRYGSLLAIADGTGGLPGGGEASQEAVRYLQTLYYAAPYPDNLPDRLRQSVEQVNTLNRLAQRHLGAERGHLTTLVAAVIHTGEIWVANVGDSRAYLVEAAGRQLVQLTEDHSRHVRDVKIGLVSDADRTSRESGIITRAIGLQDDCQVDIYHYTWAPGDRLMLCSDGLSHLVPEVIIPTTLDNLPDKASHDLVAQAVETDGSDNCTAVVAAWMPSEPSGEHPDRVETESIPLQTMPLPPKKDAGTEQSTRFSAAEWLEQQPGARMILLGVLLGWLSAALLALLLLLNGR